MKAGIAQVEYTPPPGLPLMGNFRDDYAARGVHDPLHGKAVVFEDGGGSKAAVLGIDICMLSRDNVATIRAHIADRCGIPGERVLAAATHTHAAPAPFSFAGMQSPGPEQVNAFLRKAADAVVEADRRLAPARLTHGEAREARVSFNRRLRARDGTLHMNWEGLDPASVVGPVGPADPRLQAVALETGGRTAGRLVNFGLHPAILAGDNWLYSADYPGYLAEALDRLSGEPGCTLFLNGCCGNVNHIDYTDPTQGRGYTMTQRVGYMLAAGAWEALRSAAPVADGPVAVRTEQISVPYLPITDEQQAWAQRVVSAPEKPAGQVDGLPDRVFADGYLDLAARKEPARVEVMTIRAGALAVVGLPGEIFCEYGLRIREESPAPFTLVVELANDAIGYVPTPEAFREGGYEPTPGVARLQGAGEAFTETALRQLTELFEER